MSLKFFKLGQQQSILSQKGIQLFSGALLQLSILLIFIVLPSTVIWGYITETTGRQIHDFFANLFLIVVIGHLSAIILNSLTTKQIILKKCFGEISLFIGKNGASLAVLSLLWLVFLCGSC